MATNIPDQERTVDPFASYGSDIVNQLTRMVTRVTDQSGWLNGPNDLDVTDGTVATQAIVTTGIIFKDDMQIFITSDFTVDFMDSNHYFNPNGTLNETGYYYITFEYEFIKSRPAPQGRIKILRPSERGTYPNSNLTFLKAAKVEDVGGFNVIVSLWDYDPEDTDVQRISIQQYASTEIFLPTFVRLQHQGRILYVKSTDQYYYGGETGWTFAGNVISVNQTITAPGGWTADAGIFRADVDITTLSTMNAIVSVRRDSDDYIITPANIEFTSATNVRIWMPVDTVTVHVTVVA